MKAREAKTLEDMKRLAQEWLAVAVEAREKDAEGADEKAGAFVVGLSGHLGAGKTAFVKLVAAELGIQEDVTSPTFVLMKIYGAQRGPWKRLVHIDAYRLERREDLEALRLDPIVADVGNLVMVEWPENVGLGADDLSQLMKFEISDGAHRVSW